MRLISCYIINFGAISNKEFNFDKDITSILEDNGTGKTTLASFILAMLYGLESDRSAKKFVTRKHFYPFNGGVFGGNLKIEVDKNIYIVERIFDVKSESKDKLTVYKNDSEIELSNVGETLFGIDKESFEKLIFIDSLDIEMKSTSSINSKLNNFITESKDNVTVEKAMEKIKKVRDKYSKVRGRALIDEQKDIIKSLDNKINNANNIISGLSKKKENLKSCDEEISKLKKEEDCIHKTELVLKDYEVYENYLNNVNITKSKLENIENKYNGKELSKSQDISNIKYKLSLYRSYKTQIDKTLSEEDKNRLFLLKSKFGDKDVDADIDNLKKDINSLNIIKRDIASYTNDISNEEKVLKDRFSNKQISSREIAEINSLLDKYKNLEDKTNYKLKPVKNTKYIMLSIISILIAVIGVVMLFINTIIASVLIIFGVLILLFTGFIYLNKKTSQVMPNTINTDKINLEHNIRNLIASYGYIENRNVEYLVEILNRDYDSYKNLIDKTREREIELSDLDSKYNDLVNKITNILTRYNILNSDYEIGLNNLQDELNEYRALRQIEDSLNKQNVDIISKLKDIENEVTSFSLKYDVDINSIDEYELDIKEYEKELANYNKYKEEANKFKEDKNLTDVRPNSINQEELVEIKEKMDELNKKRLLILEEIKQCEDSEIELDSLLIEKEKEEDILEDYQAKAYILDETMKLLSEAEKNLQDKFIEPIKNNFVKYALELEEALGEKISMNPDLEIQLEHNGILRSEKHLSSGQKSICAFCFRLALIDNMYINDKPFLILDDPFTSLDEKHLNKIRKLIANIAKDMQTIYFTCHNSRLI